ncbi:hypothetical protein Bresa_00460|uniref:Uncharacterized protein n=1 Tax=Brenneria salicis ATCC 15712 = DSM 30166 TaxID=714314 RepID=A0A366I0F8_9GAMM|nr:hypothetical protein [Brenneria salicis ATCC 15712 = DSM 30166]RBP59648.1 hypothetical protein DES54_13726 [Brenneria salicis ATCC 15712 = DSM 30166]
MTFETTVWIKARIEPWNKQENSRHLANVPNLVRNIASQSTRCTENPC